MVLLLCLVFLVGFIMFMCFLVLFLVCSRDDFYFLLVCIFCLEVLSTTVTIEENLLYPTLNLECSTFQFIKKPVEISPSNQIISSFRTQTCLGQGIFPGLVLY